MYVHVLQSSASHKGRLITSRATGTIPRLLIHMAGLINSWYQSVGARSKVDSQHIHPEAEFAECCLRSLVCHNLVVALQIRNQLLGKYSVNSKHLRKLGKPYGLPRVSAIR